MILFDHYYSFNRRMKFRYQYLELKQLLRNSQNRNTQSHSLWPYVGRDHFNLGNHKISVLLFVIYNFVRSWRADVMGKLFCLDFFLNSNFMLLSVPLGAP